MVVMYCGGRWAKIDITDAQSKKPGSALVSRESKQIIMAEIRTSLSAGNGGGDGKREMTIEMSACVAVAVINAGKRGGG